jgi:hypothetical protein
MCACQVSSSMSYSSMPRSSKEGVVQRGCGPRAMNMLWCHALIRMNHIISPIRGPPSTIRNSTVFGMASLARME